MTTPQLFTSTTPEWYTPAHIITLARDVLGGIDLDPASCAAANELVQSARYYAKTDNGLLQPWHGRVWLNPPYGSEIGQWTARLIWHVQTGAVSAALALLPARTDTAWFQPVHAWPRCWLRGRLRFAGAESSAPFPSVVVYFGPDVERFGRVFGSLGPVDRGAIGAPPIAQGEMF